MRQRRDFAAAGAGSSRQRQQLLAERVEIDLYGIVVHQQGAIGRHGLGHTLDLGRRERAVERQHALVGGIIDIAWRIPP